MENPSIFDKFALLLGVKLSNSPTSTSIGSGSHQSGQAERDNIFLNDIKAPVHINISGGQENWSEQHNAANHIHNYIGGFFYSIESLLQWEKNSRPEDQINEQFRKYQDAFKKNLDGEIKILKNKDQKILHEILRPILNTRDRGFFTAEVKDVTVEAVKEILKNYE